MRVALLSLLVVVGCKVANPHYCPDEPNNLCTPDGMPMKCESPDQCTTETEPVCKMPEGVCVQCTANEPGACTGMKPICNDETNQCEACDAHTDCPDSDTCLPTGACAVATDVLYVEEGGTANLECDFDSRCATLEQALAAMPVRSIVRVKGAVTGPTATITDRDLTIIGDPEAPETCTLTRNNGNEVLVLQGTSKVRIHGVRIADASGGTSGRGISASSGHTGELEVQRSIVTNNYIGIEMLGTGSLTLGRSTISLNSGGGVVLLNTQHRFDITNNFIFRNGSENSSTYSGINIPNVIGGSGSRLEFNTIVDNDALNGTGRAGGVFCDIMNFNAPNNIIAHNAVSGMFTEPNSQANGICNFTGSLLRADPADLLFVDPDNPPFNYKLKLGSAAIDAAMSGAPIMMDHEGEPRPNGMFRDMGADEYYP